MQKISCEEAYVLLKKTKAIALDLRGVQDFKNGHLPKSININGFEVRNQIESLVVDKNVPIIVYCYTGSVSPAVCLILEDLGYKNVFELGQIGNWHYKLEKI